MSALGWKIWIVPLALWGLYSCWYCGYQSGYADGHETAWNLSRSSEYFPEVANMKSIPELQERDESAATETR